MTVRAVVVRHGRTAWNAASRFQGQLDVPLDDTGRAQAVAAARLIADHRPSLLVASDLSRAAETAATIASTTGLAVRPDRRLREADAGRWQGLTHAEIEQADADLLAQWRQGTDVRPGGTGETRVEVGTRVAAAIDEHLADAAADDVAVFVTHGGAARAGIGALLGVPAEHWHRLTVLGNCGWAVLERSPDRHWRLHAYNLGALPGGAEPVAHLRDAIV